MAGDTFESNCTDAGYTGYASAAATSDQGIKVAIARLSKVHSLKREFA